VVIDVEGSDARGVRGGDGRVVPLRDLAGEILAMADGVSVRSVTPLTL